MTDDPYLMDAPTRVQNAKKLNAWLDDHMAPGQEPISVLLMVLADRIVEQAPDDRSLSVTVDGICSHLPVITRKLFRRGGL